MENLMNIKRAFVLAMAVMLLPAGVVMADEHLNSFTVKTTKVFSDGSEY